MLFGTAAVPALARGEEYEFEGLVTVPDLERGGYYLIAVVDYLDEVAETDETDNDQRALFTVGDAEGPDLAFNAVELEDEAAEPGDRVQVEYTLQNRGGADVEDFEVAYFLSPRELPSPEAVLLEREVIGNLDAGDEDDESEELTIPPGTALGQYAIFIVLDEPNEIEEPNETNNVRSAGLIEITDGTATEGGVSEPELSLAAWPNPAAGAVAMHYELTEAGPVRLALRDALGREVLVAVDAARNTGAYTVALDVSALAPGRYALVLEAGSERLTRALTIVR